MAEQLVGVLREVVAAEAGTPARGSALFTGELRAAPTSPRLARAAGAARRHRRPGGRLPRDPRRRAPTRRARRAPRGRARAHGRGAAAAAGALIDAGGTTTPTPARRDRARQPVGVARAWYRMRRSRGRRRPRPGRVPRRLPRGARRAGAEARAGVPPRAAATWRTPRAGTTSSRAPIRGSRPPPSGWRAAGPARRPRRRARGVRTDPVDLERVRRRADPQGRHHARCGRSRASPSTTSSPPARRRRFAAQGAAGAADRDVLGAALVLVADGAPAGNGADSAPPVVLGYPLTERDVRLGLETTYRRLVIQHLGRRAHRARGPGERAPTVERRERRGPVDVPRCGQPATVRRPICEARPAAHTGRGGRRADGASSTTASSVASPIAPPHRRNEDAMQVARTANGCCAVGV